MVRRFLKTTLVCLTLLAVLSTSAFAVTIGGGTVTGSEVRLRSSPDTSSAENIIREMDENTFLLIEEELPGWYKVACDGVEGYVSASFVQFAETLSGPYAYAGAATAGTCINLRADANTASAVVKNLPVSGTSLTITGVSGNWLQVRDVLGASGYIRSDLVKYDGAQAPAPGAQTIGAQIAETAKTYVGYRYVYGGASPATGFDCSGFVNYIYGLYGYKLNRVANDIYYGDGAFVDWNSLQPGDVLCFGWSGYCGHVGIYIGSGQFVHACSSTTGVIITDLSSGYYSARFLTAKRIAA